MGRVPLAAEGESILLAFEAILPVPHPPGIGEQDGDASMGGDPVARLLDDVLSSEDDTSYVGALEAHLCRAVIDGQGQAHIRVIAAAVEGFTGKGCALRLQPSCLVSRERGVYAGEGGSTNTRAHEEINAKERPS